MKNMRPVDTAGACVSSHSLRGFVAPAPVFIPRPEAGRYREGQGKSLSLCVNPPKNRAHLWMLPLLLAVCMSLALSIPVVAIAQQVPPELHEAIEYHKAGKYKDAIEVYTEYLAKNPRSAEALNWRGMAYEDLGDTTRAMEDYNKALQIKPDYADAYNNRGEIYRKEKKYREALNDYRKATEFDKNFAEAFYNMGLVQEAEKRNDLAIQAYNAYLRLKPEAPDKQQLTEKVDALKKTVAQAPPKPAEPGAAPKPGERPAAPKPGEKPAAAKPAPPKPGEMPGMTKPGAPVAGVPAPGESPIPGLTPEQFNTYVTYFKTASDIINIGGIVYYLFFAFMVFLIARKTATPLPWLAFIPIANWYLMLRIAGRPIWWLALFFVLPLLAIPLALFGAVDPTGGILALILIIVVAMVIPAILALLIFLGMASARGKSGLWGFLSWFPCTQPIGLLYLGLSK